MDREWEGGKKRNEYPSMAERPFSGHAAAE